MSRTNTEVRPTRPRVRRLIGGLSLSLLAVGSVACSSSGSASKDTTSTTVSPTNGFDPATYSGLTASLKGSGSTFQQNYLNAAIKTLSPVLPGVKIAYAGGGSGQGKSDLADGVVNFAGSDSLIKAEDVSKFPGGVLYFPTVVAPITVSYNLAGVRNVKLDGPTLAKIFSAKVTKWNDEAIATLNPGIGLSATPINVCHRSDASGTTTNFSKFLASAGTSDWTLGTGDTIQWPTGTQGASGNGGVAQCINGKAGSIGYVDLSDAKSQRLSFASIKNRSGSFVQPTLAGASAAAANADVAADLTYSPIDTTGTAAYSITSPTWIIVSPKQSSHSTGTAIKALLEFVLTDGQDATFTGSVNYAPLPKALAAKAIAQLDKIKVP